MKLNNFRSTQRAHSTGRFRNARLSRCLRFLFSEDMTDLTGGGGDTYLTKLLSASLETHVHALSEIPRLSEKL